MIPPADLGGVQDQDLMLPPVAYLEVGQGLAASAERPSFFPLCHLQGNPKTLPGQLGAQFFQHVLGLPQGILLMGGGVFRKPDQVASSSELFHLLLLVEEQQLYPETLRASRPVSEGEPRHPVEETYLCRLCLWSHSFLLYPQLVATRSERRWSVKSRLFLFSIAPSIEPRLMHCWLCIDPPVNLPLHSSFIRETGPLNFSTWGKIWSSKQREHSNLCGPLLWIWRYRFHPSCLTRSCKRLCGDPVLSPQPRPPPVCLSLANTEAVFHACYLLHTGATNDTSESSHAEGSRVSPDAFLWYMIIYLQMYGCKWLFICISYPTVHMHQIHSIPAMRLWLF